MRTSSICKVIAIVTALVAIVAFAMPFLDAGFWGNMSGFELLEILFDAIDSLSFTGLCILLTVVFAALSFIFSLIALKTPGVLAIIFSILGVIAMVIGFADTGFDGAGSGVYVYIIGLVLTFIFSIIGAATRNKY